MSARGHGVLVGALLGLLVIGGASLYVVDATAAPAGWEDDFGPALAGLAGQDDAAEAVALGFPFPYAGQTYTTVYVGTNGAVSLGGLGEADDYPSTGEFAETTAPMVAPFWTDLSLASQGSVHFKGSGDRAVATWNGVGSYENQTASFTFQLQIFADGRILFLYNGIPPLAAENIDKDVFVGLTEGNLPEEPAPVDYTTDDEILVGESVLEIFAVSAYFDLDGASLLFTPHPQGGFVADASIISGGAAARPAMWEPRYGTALENFDDWDDGSRTVTLGFPFPYDGQTYTDLYIGTNGAIGLGALGEANYYPSGNEFLTTSAPIVAGFWSDMSAAEQGGIYFNDFGDRAVVTWRGIGTYQDETASFTFQAQLFAGGRIVYAYNGIPRLNEENIDEPVYVGLTPGSLAAMPPGAEIDYMAQAPFASGITVVQEFPIDSLFDLDMMTVVFDPIDGTGYAVSVLPPEASARALPAVWEMRYGPSLEGFDGWDDGAEEVTLTFPFPYGGQTYTTLHVGTNGAVALGAMGEADSYPELGNEFLTTTAPMTAPFWSDMSLEERGAVFFKDTGDRAVITWSRVGSYENKTAPFTFQMQLHTSGGISFAYNGISALSPENIDTSAYVGLTPGNLAAMPPGAEVDYTHQAPFTSGITVLEIFPVGSIFDLDLRTIRFDPIAGTGYTVSVLEPQPTGPEGVTIIGIGRGPNGIQFNWMTEAGVTYTVQSQSVPGGEWTDLATVVGTGEEIAFIDTRPLASAVFYRVLR